MSAAAASGAREQAQALAAALPPLLAEAQRLAATVVMGAHGRRRAGPGAEFWQYRAAMPGDSLRMIDWRRSARSDAPFIREREWQAAQSVALWVDTGRAMEFSGAPAQRPEKGARARLLALALAALLLRGGERVGLAAGSQGMPRVTPRAGRGQLVHLASMLMAQRAEAERADTAPAAAVPAGHLVMMSDFLGDSDALEAAVTAAAGRGARGVLLQVLDPVEETFPYSGRTLFESLSGETRFETRQADDLRRRYQDRLAARKHILHGLAQRVGWQYDCHHTDGAALGALIWLHNALEGQR